jgi:hypothetical protein
MSTTILPPADIHTRPTLPWPPPSRALLAAARRHDAMTSAAVLVRPTRPQCARTLPAIQVVRVAVATAALLLTPLLARGAEPVCKRVVVMQETTGSGDTTIVVRYVCSAPASKK